MTAVETCFACDGGPTLTRVDVTESDNIALCTRHWNWWLIRYLAPSALEPPCAAHLILGVTP